MGKKMKYGGCFKTLILLVTALLAMSCNQDPIFYKISQETKPLEPRIKGTPSNMTVFNRVDPTDPAKTKTVPMLFVASGRLHWYARPPANAGPAWDSGDFGIPQPGGNVFGLTSTKDYLYVLSFTGSGLSAEVKRLGWDKDEWELVNADSADSDALTHRYYQTIYADSGGRVFIGSRRSGSTAAGSYAILYCIESGSDLVFRTLKSGIEVLKGAAWDGSNHFLATDGSGIFMVAEASLSKPAGPDPKDTETLETAGSNSTAEFNGIINISLPNIIAAGNNGNLYSVAAASGYTFLGDYASYSTGALALWCNPAEASDSVPSPAPKLLLAGRQGSKTLTTSSGYTHGYMEIDIINDNIDSNMVVHEPGIGSNTSITNNERYTASIGKYPINFIFQVPRDIDRDMPLFASTQTHGLWSYRVRDGEPQWNAED
jgi:hypothetical protein